MIIVLALLTLSFFVGLALAIIGKEELRVVGFVLVLLGTIGMILNCWTIVSPGTVKVPILVGEVQQHVLDEGFHLVNPLYSFHEMSVRTETYNSGDTKITALSKDKLQMKLDVTAAYRLVAKEAPWVYQNLGPDYVNKLFLPAVRSGVRNAVSHYTAQEAMADKREDLIGRIEQEIGHQLAGIVSNYEGRQNLPVLVSQTMLRDIDPPAKVKDSIEDKLRAEQDALKMEFVLNKERKEAERKRIEAKGIQTFQEIVRKGIDEKLLRWKGIEATERLASTENSKLVIIGGRDGLPLILNPS